MDDQGIVELYWKRSERAISETDAKYGGYCYHIAYNILANKEDAEESVSDTYLAAWHKMPPQRPACLSPMLGKLTRNISISRWRKRSASKRGGGVLPLALEELGECVSDGHSIEEDYLRKEAVEAFNRFLAQLPKEERIIFLSRYWRLDSIEAIADTFGYSKSKVKYMLHRTRKKLRGQLEQEGLI